MCVPFTLEPHCTALVSSSAANQVLELHSLESGTKSEVIQLIMFEHSCTMDWLSQRPSPEMLALGQNCCLFSNQYS